MPQDLLDAATAPTRERLSRLAERVSPPVAALLTTISDHYFDRQVPLVAMRRNADANEWHVTLFYRELGLTPRDLLRHCRVESACYLLRYSAWPLLEIARAVGYVSDRGLRKLFYDLAGDSPKRVRDDLKEIPPDLEKRRAMYSSWYFRVCHHRGELQPKHYRAALDYLQALAGRFS